MANQRKISTHGGEQLVHRKLSFGCLNDKTETFKYSPRYIRGISI